MLQSDPLTRLAYEYFFERKTELVDSWEIEISRPLTSRADPLHANV
jgi:hypothetical protein